jgi:hypothetical protein
MEFAAIRGRFVNADQAIGFLNRMWAQIKPHLLMDGVPLRVTVQEETRTSEQNALFHDCCDDIAKHGFVWAGKRRNTGEVKVLLVSGHATATKEGSEVVPGLEGEFINLRESTALMSKRRGSSLIEYTLAFMALNDITRRPNGGRA